jgi:hypothetical protein
LGAHELAQRIQRLLTTLSDKSKKPNRLELHCLLDALRHLKEGNWACGEEAVTRAERAGVATPEQIATVPAPVDPINVVRLRQRFDRIVGTSGFDGLT